MKSHSNIRSTLTVLLLAALATVVAAGVGAQPPRLPGQTPIADLEAWDEHMLMIDGVEVDAEIHYSRYELSWCISAAELGGPLLLSPRGRSVQRIDSGKLRLGKGLVSKLDAGAADEFVGQYRQEGEAKIFELDGHEVRLVPRPPLVGSKSAEDLRRHLRRYGHFSEAHRPKAAVDARRFARGGGQDLVVRVYFGSWSKASERMVPKILRLEGDLKGRVRFEYIGLSRPLTHDPVAREAKVYSLPTAVVLLDGEEVGRLFGRPLDTPATSLYELLSQTSG